LVNVTYNDGSSGNLSAVSLAATRRASFMVSLNGFIPAADAGKYIRDINSVTLSATTGTAGNFGFTATRRRAALPLIVTNIGPIFDWQQTRMAEIFNSSCLFLIQMANATTTGTVRGFVDIAHG
jgi:hypothetical protein